MLGCAFTLATQTVRNKDFRIDILRMILQIYENKQSVGTSDDYDFYKIVKCQFYLNLPDSTATLLERLILSDKPDDFLVAYQIAFDIVEKEN